MKQKEIIFRSSLSEQYTVWYDDNYNNNKNFYLGMLYLLTFDVPHKTFLNAYTHDRGNKLDLQYLDLLLYEDVIK